MCFFNQKGLLGNQYSELLACHGRSRGTQSIRTPGPVCSMFNYEYDLCEDYVFFRVHRCCHHGAPAQGKYLNHGLLLSILRKAACYQTICRSSDLDSYPANAYVFYRPLFFDCPFQPAFPFLRHLRCTSKSSCCHRQIRRESGPVYERWPSTRSTWIFIHVYVSTLLCNSTDCITISIHNHLDISQYRCITISTYHETDVTSKYGCVSISRDDSIDRSQCHHVKVS